MTSVAQPNGSVEPASDFENASAVLSEKHTSSTEVQTQIVSDSTQLTQPDATQQNDPAEVVTQDAEKRTKAQDKQPTTEPQKQGPAGGHDSTPIPHAPPGYRVKFTFHSASALPIADLVTLSSDPYLYAELTTGLPTRHKEDPILRFRSRTLWNTTDPLWNEQWILDHVPSSGFKLKVRIYDEDMGDSDDRLGNVHINVDRIDEKWPGIHKQAFKIKKRMGSKRAYMLRAIAVCMGQASEMNGRLNVSVEVMGRSPGEDGGRAYTIGPNYWCKHYSPLLGRLIGNKRDPEDNRDDDDDEYEDDTQNGRTPIQATTNTYSKSSKPIPLAATLSKRKKTSRPKSSSRYNFQANQMQLIGPPPAELYHRYVEFRPFIKALFTARGIRGIILQKGLHHQHAQVYNFNRDTKYGVYRQTPCTQMTEKFLELCHYAEGGRMFTYVITLDALMRFTETGKEFGIDLLSKHTMHSDASIYIAYSGEFFIRPKNRSHRKGTGQSANGTTPQSASLQIDTQNVHSTQASHASNGSSRDPSNYELVIDNDSGTYRPNGKLLPVLRDFLCRNFPGLKIVTLDSQNDAELMKKLKTEQRERKRKAGGDQIVYTQISASSSESTISSSDEETLDRRAAQQMVDHHTSEQQNGTTVTGEASESTVGEPKHRIGEAVLPFISNQKIRKSLQSSGVGASASPTVDSTASPTVNTTTTSQPPDTTTYTNTNTTTTTTTTLPTPDTKTTTSTTGDTTTTLRRVYVDDPGWI